MLPVFVLIIFGVFAYLWWKHTRTTLTRNCRWRLNKPLGQWRCASCGALTPDTGRSPRHCAGTRQ